MYKALVHRKKIRNKISLVLIFMILFSLSSCTIRKDETSEGKEGASAFEAEEKNAQVPDESTRKENDESDYEKWSADLKQLEEDITWYNAAPFERYGKDAFYQLYREIEAGLPSMTNSEREYKLRELIYSIGDGHIDMWTDKENAHGLPLMIDELKDGFYVINATVPYKSLVGQKIESINGVDVNEIVSKLERISNSENEYWRRSQAIEKLHYSYFYRLLGIEGDNPEIILVNETPVKCFDMLPLSAVFQWVKPFQLAEMPNGFIKEMIIYEAPYYYEFLEGDKVLRIVFSSCYHEDESYSLTDFGKDVLKDALLKKPEVLIIDLRDNGGGRASQLYAALPERFFKQTGFEKNPKFFVAIDEGTFSAGVLTAHVLKERFGATLIGTPTGGSPYTTGVTDTANKVLRNSGIQFRVSSEKVGKKMIENPTEHPDVLIEKTSADLNAGLDPVIEYAKSFVWK